MWNLNLFSKSKKKPAEKPSVKLKQPGWSPEVRSRLEYLIAEGSGKELSVVLDLDNTILCRDIGEATFAILEQQGCLSKDRLPIDLTPDFFLNNQIISLANSPTLLDYYHHLTKATAHQTLDTAIEMIGYNWAVLIMQGLTPMDIINATEIAYADGIGAKELQGSANPEDKNLPFLRPFFYPQMVEFIGVLLAHSYDVWVISSSNSWSVRWMLLKAIDEQLSKEGFAKLLQPTRVMGISTLLKGIDSRLYKDGFLVWDNPEYAQLDPETLKKYTLTGLGVPPVTASYGKVAEIMQWIGHSPYIVAGDSFGDIPMLKYAQNRLFIARLEHPEFHEYIAPLTLRKGDLNTWMIQPTLSYQSPGFLHNAAELDNRKSDKFPQILKSLGVFDSYHLLNNFWSE